MSSNKTSKKSYFSRDAISDIIKSTIKILNQVKPKEVREVAEKLLERKKIHIAIYNILTGEKRKLQKESKSYFSKKSIAEMITEIKEIYEETKEKEEVFQTKEEIGNILIREGRISEAIFYELVGSGKNLGDCHAVIKKGGRCGNPITKVGSIFCALHMLNKPDITWDEYELVKCNVERKTTTT